MDKKKIIISTGILISLTLALIGGTYAWFSAFVTNNADNKGVTITTGKLGITYTDGNVIEADNIFPGWSESKTFSVKNTGDVEATYKIVWANLTNTFVNKDELRYKITSDNDGGELNYEIKKALDDVSIPDSGENIEIISNIRIPVGVTQTYTLKLTYANNNKDQNSDQGKVLSGKIEVREDQSTKIASGLSKYLIDNYEKLGMYELKHDATINQKYLATDYRYTGATPNNYVTYNNELWRIIGVFETENASGVREYRTKLIRNDSIGSYSWDTSSSEVNEGHGVNEWSGADLMKLLNPGYESEAVGGSLYWNRGTGNCYTGNNNANSACDFSDSGLISEAKTLIDDAKWYTGGRFPKANSIIAEEHYYLERGIYKSACTKSSCLTDTVERKETWIGKVGLAYESDYRYGTSIQSCLIKPSETGVVHGSECVDTNWMIFIDTDKSSWSISPLSSYLSNSVVLKLYNGGEGDAVYYDGSPAFNSYLVHPSVYLKSNVKLTSGTGTKTDPYQISL